MPIPNSLSRQLRPTVIMQRLEAELDKIPDSEMELRVRLLEKLSELRLAQYNAQQERRKRRERNETKKNKNKIPPQDNALIARKRKQARAPEEPEPVTNWDKLV